MQLGEMAKDSELLLVWINILFFACCTYVKFQLF